MKRIPVQMRMDSDVLARVDAEAKRLGQTRTMFVERALRVALKISKDYDHQTYPDEKSTGPPQARLEKQGLENLHETIVQPESRKKPSLKETWAR